MHNNLRITRILKSLGELGFEHYQVPLVRFFLEETLVKKTLGTVKRSVLDYFLFAVLDKQKRQELVRFAYLNFEPKDKFVWCPRKIQKQFKKAEKRTDAVGNGEGKDDACSQGKGKDGEAVMQHKQDGLDDTSKPHKGTDKTASKEKNKLSEASCEPKPDADAVNGNEQTESSNEIVGNGNYSADDDDEMDQSPSSDTSVTKTEPSADSQQNLSNDLNNVPQEPDNNMQTDEDIDTEKPPKKKRDDTDPVSNGSDGDSASGHVEEKADANKGTGQTSPSEQSCSRSVSLSLGKGEKIPRTEFDRVTEKEEKEDASQEHVPAANGSLMSANSCVDEKTNGKESEDVIMESDPSSANQNVGNSWINVFFVLFFMEKDIGAAYSFICTV